MLSAQVIVIFSGVAFCIISLQASCCFFNFKKSIFVGRRTPERVLKDLFHLFKGIRDALGKTHPLARIFMAKIRDAVLHVDKSHITAAQEVLRTRGMPEEEIRRLPTSYYISKQLVQRRALPVGICLC
jgi:hypothetical protein